MHTATETSERITPARARAHRARFLEKVGVLLQRLAARRMKRR